MQQQPALDKVPLFEGLEAKHLAVLGKMVQPRQYKDGETIVQQGEGGIGLYVIQSGEVEVTQKHGDAESRIRTMGPGESFGEIALLTDQPRSATVRALQPTACWVMSAWEFRSALQESPEMALRLLKTVAQRLIEAEERASH
ncbi:MAG TPA: cyclic nucleotide-binding domain-containing protein [Chloroflexota bacterium]|jgi:CRP-like cAMP-binding protein